MGELEDLQYSGLAFAYMDDDIQYASTSNASSCATPKFVDYLRSTIVAGKSCFRSLNFCVLMWFIFSPVNPII